jgi:hypothetical protein
MQETKRTWKPIVAGILVIIPGALGIVGGATWAIPIIKDLILKEEASDWWALAVLPLPWALSALFAGIIAAIGGIYALRRRSWGLALAGSIFTLPGWVVLGILLPVGLTPAVAAGAALGVLAIVLIIMGRREFEHRARPMADTGFCPACGAPAATQTEICANCGAKLTGAAERRTWKPKAGGILAIVAGVLTVIVGIILVSAGADLASEWWGFGMLLFALAGLGLLAILIGVFAVVGGICALRRRVWGLALAGSICAIPAGVVLGVLAIIFIIKGKHEFR